MTDSLSVPTVQKVRDMLEAARNSPMGRYLSESGFDIDMNDPDQANRLAMYVLHQLQVMDSATRMLAVRVEALEATIERSDALFV